MDTKYIFPRPQLPVPRIMSPATPTSQPPNSSRSSARESNTLRASVLDAALELGIGSSSLVTSWMFNNEVREEDEEHQPNLTYGSSVTSEDSSFAALTPSPSSLSSGPSSKKPGAGDDLMSNGKSALGKNVAIRISESETEGETLKSSSNTVSFPRLPTPNRSTAPISPATRKLKKKTRGDGYESDAGYLSESGKRKDKDQKKAESKDALETEKEAKKRAKEEKKEQLEEEKKRKKSLLAAAKAAKKAESKDGYDTDGGGISSFMSKPKAKKSKSKTEDGNTGGYETDGYQSSGPTPGLKKSKSRFFKLSNKSSKPDLRAVPVPDLPPMIPLTLPIAERFGTTLIPGGDDAAASSRAPSPFSALLSGKSGNSLGSFPRLSTPATQNSGFSPAPSTVSVNAPSPIPPGRESFGSSSSIGSNPRRHVLSPSREGSESGHRNSGSLSTESHQHEAQSGPLKPPPMSHPGSRSHSPLPPRLQLAQGLKNMTYSSKPPPSPMSPSSPHSPTSPYTVYAIGSPPAATPLIAGGFPSLPHSHSPSPIPRARNDIPRSLRKQVSQPNLEISHPNTSVERRYHKPAHLILHPEADNYVVPSPTVSSRSALTAPKVLAYYDIPPPSPPPMGPLPSVPKPPPSSSNQSQFPPASVLRQRVIDRRPRHRPVDVATLQNIQRGKDSPFPARPVMPGRPLSGMELRVAARHSLYSLSDEDHHQSEDGHSHSHDGFDDERQEMLSVMDRFEQRRADSVEGRPLSSALARSQSPAAASVRRPQSGASFSSGYSVSRHGTAASRDSHYSLDEGRTIGDRSSTWTGSVYSRYSRDSSLYDEETSGHTRERLVKNVEEMLEVEANLKRVHGPSGRRHVPPVPKLPQAYTNMNSQLGNAGIHSNFF